MGSEKSVETGAPPAAVDFASAAEADRRVAGVSVAGRMVRALVDAGCDEIWLRIGDSCPLAAATGDDIARLRGSAGVEFVGPRGAPAGVAATPAPAMDSMAILRATAKPGDGLISRNFNRPVSQRISRILLAFPGARPIHATIASAVLALVLFVAMVTGGHGGLILGAVLFQAASVIDGVDGEMARATWRASDFGKSLDSTIDMVTNVAFILGLTINLGRTGDRLMLGIGLWSVVAVATGAALIAWRVRSGGGPLNFDLLKPRPVAGDRIGLGDALLRIGTLITSRDFFAFYFMVVIIAGQARPALYIFAAVASGWFLYVLAALLPRQRPGFRSAA